MKSRRTIVYGILASLFVIYVSGCTINNEESQIEISSQSNEQIVTETTSSEKEIESESSESVVETLLLNSIPSFSAEPYTEINSNIPFFTESDKQSVEAFEYYSDLDDLGRCGPAYANICVELQPTEERGTIGNVRPSGWHTVKYNEIIDGNYLYNRCHLIGYQLAGENANEKNLITGTRYLNVIGMLYFENMVDDYVEQTHNHVLYRVTPIFCDNDLVARGVQMEAWSVEDSGSGICFNVFCYNVQPGIVIDYSSGESYIDNTVQEEHENNELGNLVTPQEDTYILNTNTRKIHLPSCSSVNDMTEKNKQEYTGDLNDLLANGYALCKRCLDCQD